MRGRVKIWAIWFAKMVVKLVIKGRRKKGHWLLWLTAFE